MPVTRLLWICWTSRPIPEPADPANWSLDCRPPEQALAELRAERHHALVLDVCDPPASLPILVSIFQSLVENLPIFVHGLAPDAATAALDGLGAVILPPEGDCFTAIRAFLEARARRGLVRLAESVSNEGWEDLLIGTSGEMRQVRHVIRMVGARRATVLVSGETGTGKELAARALHRAGPRGAYPLVPVNCSALPDNLLEAELFGHVRGAFTGAVQSRVGRFEQAHGGTIFLDEVGELPLDLQAKLLRVLQEREFQRLGSSETIRVDVRVIAATNRDLLQRVEQGQFREDLYYRLAVVPLPMPPLRQRRGDIPLLARHFLEKICAAEEIALRALTPDAMEHLGEYSWPGNVRQLENAVEMAVALSGERKLLHAGDFPLPGTSSGPSAPAGAPLIPVPDSGLDFEQTVAFIERSILQQALRKTGGNKKAAAEMLRLKRTTLAAKVRSLESESDTACN